jgi:hypothetical protein
MKKPKPKILGYIVEGICGPLGLCTTYDKTNKGVLWYCTTGVTLFKTLARAREAVRTTDAYAKRRGYSQENHMPWATAAIRPLVAPISQKS